MFECVPGEDDDAFRFIRTYVAAWNLNAAVVLEPSYILVPDESMWWWTGRNMPGFCVEPRKPRDKGLQSKTLADGLSKCLLRIDMQEGAVRMQDKKYNKEWGKSAGCTLRLTEPWHGSGRIVIGDSWFGNMNNISACLSHGLFPIFNMKGACKAFPIEEVKSQVTKEKRTYSLMAKIKLKNGEEYHVTAGGHKERQPMVLAATCSTMQRGPDRHLCYYSIHRRRMAQRKSTVSHMTQPRCTICTASVLCV